MNVQSPCIPFPQPSDEEEVKTIKKLVIYVARNGDAFEEKIKQKEKDNPKFSFLDKEGNPDGFQYYQWMLFCAKSNYAEEDIVQIEDEFRKQLSCSESGLIALKPDDELMLASLLSQNTGSKENIKQLRRWTLERAHSCIAIVRTMLQFIRLLDPRSSGVFSTMLHTIYVVNDMFYNGGSATSSGPYTRMLPSHKAVSVTLLMVPFIAPILHKAYVHASAEAEREKLVRIVNLWVTKNFIEEVVGQELMASMTQPQAPQEPTVQLTPPFPVYLPPPQQAPLPPAPNQIAALSQPIMHLAPLGHPLAPPSHHSQMPPPTATAFPQNSSGFDPVSGLMLPQALNTPAGLGGQGQGLNIPGAPSVFLPTALAGATAAAAAVASAMQQNQQQQHALGYGGAAAMPQPLTSHQLQHQFSPFASVQLSTQAITPSGMQILPTFAIPVSVPTVATPVLDLHKSSVGTMANIVKSLLKSGHSRYAPVDVSAVSQAVPPYVEPGRLEARVSEFYRKLQQLVAPIIAGGAPPSLGPIDSSFLAPSLSAMPDSNISTNSDWGHQGGAHKDGGLVGFKRAAAAPLSDDNIGHKLLRGLGWQEGSGLGADGSGRVDIINDEGNKGKMGVGMGSDPATIAGEFSQYRQQLSDSYYTRIIDRER